MKITEVNALRIAAVGASVYWGLASISLGHDWATGELNSKSGWMVQFVGFSAFCGIAFYAMLVPAIYRSIKASGLPRTAKEIASMAWASSPLPTLAASAALFLAIAFRNG